MRYALITIAAPLDGGELEDAQALAELVNQKALTQEPSSISEMLHGDGLRVFGRIDAVTLEER